MTSALKGDPFHKGSIYIWLWLGEGVPTDMTIKQTLYVKAPPHDHTKTDSWIADLFPRPPWFRPRPSMRYATASAVTLRSSSTSGRSRRGKNRGEYQALLMSHVRRPKKRLRSYKKYQKRSYWSMAFGPGELAIGCRLVDLLYVLSNGPNGIILNGMRDFV